MATRERRPDYALLVDVCAANTKSRQGHVVDFRQRSLCRIRTWNDPCYRARESSDRAPDGTIGWTRHDGVEAGHDPLVLGRVDRLVRLDVGVALTIAIRIEDQRRPALRFGDIARLVENLH